VKTLVLRDGVLPDERTENEEDGAEDGKRRRGVRVFDLTDQVKLDGSWAVGFGTFSDVWKGTWKDPMERRERAVAVKFLRSVMVQNVKEKLIRVRILFSLIFDTSLTLTCSVSKPKFPLGTSFAIGTSANSLGSSSPRVVSAWSHHGIRMVLSPTISSFPPMQIG